MKNNDYLSDYVTSEYTNISMKYVHNIFWIVQVTIII